MPTKNDHALAGIQIGKDSDVGKVRLLNEDAYGTPQMHKVAEQAQAQRGTLVAVADGMGGHAAGEVASHMAIDTLFAEYYASVEADLAKALEGAFAKANEAIYTLAANDSSKTSMGTTLVAAVVKDQHLYVANVGDSRAYWIQHGQIDQVTEDHSWVAEQVRAGMLKKEQAKRHLYKNIITRAVGHEPVVKTDVFHRRLQSKSALVLCSDGLANKVEPDEIRQIVMAALPPQDAVKKLIELANERGAEDNVTAIVVQIPSTAARFGLGLIATLALGLLAVGLLACVLVTFLIPDLPDSILSNFGLLPTPTPPVLR